MMMGVLLSHYSSMVKSMIGLRKCGLEIMVLLLAMGISVCATEDEKEDNENLYYIVTAEGGIVITGSPNREEITIPAKINGISVVGIAEKAFFGRSDIKNITIQSGVRYVGEGAFADCKSLEAITLENGLQYIGKSAFSGDGALEDIVMPDSMAFVGENAFGNCTGLETVIFPQAAHVDDYAFEGSLWQELRDQGDFQIRGSCLLSVRGREEGILEVPYGVTRTVDNPSASGYVRAVVGQYKYIAEGTKTADEIESYFKYDILQKDAVVITKYLGDETFVFVPERLDGKTVSVVGEGAFQGNDSIEQVLLPPGIEVIEDQAFQNCPSLEYVVMGTGLKSIGQDAFSNCLNLKELRLPEGMMRIDSCICAYCPNLEKVIVPQSMEKICSSAFMKCNKLYLIYGSNSCAESFAQRNGLVYVDLERIGEEGGLVW